MLYQICGNYAYFLIFVFMMRELTLIRTYFQKIELILTHKKPDTIPKLFQVRCAVM